LATGANPLDITIGSGVLFRAQKPTAAGVVPTSVGDILSSNPPPHEPNNPSRVGRLLGPASFTCSAKMKSVFILWHTHELPGQEDDSKLIGVYETAELAGCAKKRAACLPGFADHPNGFEICEYQVGRDGWTEGFATTKYSEKKRRPRQSQRRESGGLPVAGDLPHWLASRASRKKG
jgi:hypothetical protein